MCFCQGSDFVLCWLVFSQGLVSTAPKAMSSSLIRPVLSTHIATHTLQHSYCNAQSFLSNTRRAHTACRTQGVRTRRHHTHCHTHSATHCDIHTATPTLQHPHCNTQSYLSNARRAHTETPHALPHATCNTLQHTYCNTHCNTHTATHSHTYRMRDVRTRRGRGCVGPLCIVFKYFKYPEKIDMLVRHAQQFGKDLGFRIFEERQL